MKFEFFGSLEQIQFFFCVCVSLREGIEDLTFASCNTKFEQFVIIKYSPSEINRKVCKLHGKLWCHSINIT